jgi:AraC-like DNA-binding protein
MEYTGSIRKCAIAYSCHFSDVRQGEQFAAEHVLSYQISGKLKLNTVDQEHLFQAGDFRFLRRNQLIKFHKQPADDGPFKSISLYLDQNFLRKFGLEHGYPAANGRNSHAQPIKRNELPLSEAYVIPIQGGNLFRSFMESLLPYIDEDQLVNDELQALKVREAIMILLQYRPSLREVLFDFSEPGKLDLEAFMTKNFHFNVDMNRFAYLTGRSLASFKRDFQQVFNMSPGRWLHQRRLQEAHYLIKEKGTAPSDVYLEVGFEDLSHFSFAFKKQYGLSPSKLA